MKTRLSKLMVLPLDYFELPPLLHFLSLPFLPPMKLKNIYRSTKGDIKCVISIPSDVDPPDLICIWISWKEKRLDSEYAVQN